MIFCKEKSMSVTFSQKFKISPFVLQQEQLFNSTVDIDSYYYIHPQLLKNTRNPFLISSYNNMKKRLSRYILIINSITDFSVKDISYRTIINEFSFDEPNGLCIGYSKKRGTHGSGLKGKHALQIIESIYQIRDKSIIQPELIELLPFIEKRIGADRLSDMVASIIEEDLAVLTESFVKKYELEDIREIEIGKRKYLLPWIKERNDYILLLPLDILEHLPVATSFDDIEQIIQHNESLRMLYNQLLKDAARAHVRPQKDSVKAALREKIINDEDVLSDLITNYIKYQREPLNFDKYNKHRIYNDNAEHFYFSFLRKESFNPRSVIEVVDYLLLKFKEYSEINGLAKAFIDSNGSLKEEAPQRVFQSFSQLYIEDKNIDISPEVNMGLGELDFKFSRGDEKVIIEFKLSSHTKWRDGLSKQLIAYYNAEKPQKGYYVIFHTGKFDDKMKLLREDLKSLKSYNIEIIDIDCSKKISASKL